MDETLPPFVGTLPIEQVYQRRGKYHGIAAHGASNGLHPMKGINRLPADFALLPDRTGNVYRADDRSRVGSHTTGGETRGEG